MAASSLGVVFRSRDLRFLLLNETVLLNKLIALITFLREQPNLRAISELFNPSVSYLYTCIKYGHILEIGAGLGGEGRKKHIMAL